jgi:CRP/FNR family transcriptional regulator, cyclic AMP receptor protein
VATEKQEAFDYSGFVAKQGGGSAAQYAGDEIVYTQGDPADALFYIASGAVKVTAISEYGKEASDTLAGTGPLNGGRMETRV